MNGYPQVNAMAPYGTDNRSGKPDYTAYVSYMEDVLGRRRSQITLDEKNVLMVTTFPGTIGATTVAVDVKAVAGQILSVMGTASVPAGSDANTAHGVRIRLAGTSDVEVNPLTRIRITKESTVEDIVNLGRPAYIDINWYKQLTTAALTGPSSVLFKDRTLWFRYPTNIELNGEEHLKFYVVAEAPVGGPTLPDIALAADHIKISHECDVWV